MIIVTPSQWLFGLISKCGWYSKISNVLFHQHSSEVTCSLIRKSWKHFGHFWSLKTCLGQYQHRLALATTNADQLADFQIGADAIMIMITIRIECVGCYQHRLTLATNGVDAIKIKIMNMVIHDQDWMCWLLLAAPASETDGAVSIGRNLILY